MQYKKNQPNISINKIQHREHEEREGMTFLYTSATSIQSNKSNQTQSNLKINKTLNYNPS